MVPVFSVIRKSKEISYLPVSDIRWKPLHTGFAQSFQHGFGSFEMFEAAVTLGSGIVIYVYHIFTALVFLGISKPAGYTSGTRNFPEVLCVHSRNSGINTARICA